MFTIKFMVLPPEFPRVYKKATVYVCPLSILLRAEKPLNEITLDMSEPWHPNENLL